MSKDRSQARHEEVPSASSPLSYKLLSTIVSTSKNIDTDYLMDIRVSFSITVIKTQRSGYV